MTCMWVNSVSYFQVLFNICNKLFYTSVEKVFITTWLTLYLVGPATVLRTIAEQSLPCSSGEMGHYSCQFLEGSVFARG